MNLITLHFILGDEDQKTYIQELNSLKPFWEKHGYSFSLFRDATHKERYIQLMFTENSIDDLTLLIQTQPQAKQIFESIKETKSRILIQVFEQIV